MSSIFLCVGQCGNQIAKSLIDTLDANSNLQCHKSFDGKYRFINIDSEIKVINSLRRGYKSQLRDENLLSTKFGRGNNWATGYKGLLKDNSNDFIIECMDCIRKEAEKCDFLSSFIMFHSLSGGTGSGTGSKLIELIRDEYNSKKLLFTCSVAPFTHGESPLQHYNSLLSTTYLQEFSDCIILFQNDDILRCLEAAKSTHLSFEGFNDFITRAFLNITSPTESLTRKKESSIGMELFELQRLLCSNPSLKIIEMVSIGEPSKGYFAGKLKTNMLHADLTKNYAKLYRFNKSYKTLNSICIIKGQEISSNLGLIYHLDQNLKSMLNTITWNPNTLDYWSSKQCLKLKNDKIQFESINFALNRSYCVDFLKEICSKASIKYENRAYIHWYERYGIDEMVFDRAFATLNSMIESYHEMIL